MRQKKAAQYRTERDAKPGRSRPDSNGANAIALLREHVRKDRERARHQSGCTETHECARRGEDISTLGPGREGGPATEDDEAAHKHPFAPDAIAERPERQQQAREDDGVGVDHPLELASAGPEGARDRR